MPLQHTRQEDSKVEIVNIMTARIDSHGRPLRTRRQFDSFAWLAPVFLSAMAVLGFFVFYALTYLN